MIQAHVLHGGSHLFFKQHMVLIRLPRRLVGTWHGGDFVSKDSLGPGGGREAAEKTEREMILSHPQQSLNHRQHGRHPRLRRGLLEAGRPQRGPAGADTTQAEKQRGHQ